jgi:hypothetical protein
MLEAVVEGDTKIAAADSCRGLERGECIIETQEIAILAEGGELPAEYGALIIEHPVIKLELNPLLLRRGAGQCAQRRPAHPERLGVYPLPQRLADFEVGLPTQARPGSI